ncbi:uncharacterized protein [Leptinotarsa decemlineata]|uniref:uncharacterized protein n=1 Tax=Leptinotarsa decemlineata TaxID=7539 RepID=UPI003D307C58
MMNVNQKHRQSNASSEQKQLLLEFFKKNPRLISGKFSNEFTQKDAQILWQELAVLLNSCGGGTNKDWKSWRKTWHDIRSRTKVKQGHFNRYQRGTGGGPAVQDPKNEFEREVLETIKPVSIQGHLNVKESCTDFTFDTIGKDDLIPFDSSKGNQENPIDDVNIDEFKPIQLECGPSTSKETPKSCDQKKFPRATRKKLIYSSEAAANYKVSLDRKNCIKEKYYEQKIMMMKTLVAVKEKSVTAKERIAAAMEESANYLRDLVEAIC